MAVDIGSLPGIQYGFRSIDARGTIHEQYISYMAFDGEMLYVIITAYDPQAMAGTFDALEDLLAFQPYLTAMLKELQI